MYAGEKLDFVWEEGGISLHFPAAASSKTNIEISVAVVGDVQKHSILELPYRLMTAASATYKITASAPLPVAVKVRMQHCVVLESRESLTLMVADRGPPYYFKPLPGAIFPPESSYGEIEVQSFSFFKFLKWPFRHTIRLSIQVFYHEDSTATFVVTKNIPAHLNAVKESIHINCIHYEDMPMTCENSIEAITLSVPVDSINGWHVSSRTKPAEIKMFDIDKYEPRQTCPKIMLRMKWKGSGNPTEESIGVPIQGGSIESYDLLCKPTPQKQGHSSQAQTLALPQTSSTTTVSPASLSDPPTLPLLQTFPKRSTAAQVISDKDITNIAKNISDWEALAMSLNISAPEMKQIRDSFPADVQKQGRECLQKWKVKQGRAATYQALITAAEEARDQQLADGVRDIKKSL